MSGISNPELFSTYFKLDPTKLASERLIDPFLNVDVPLFIDPVLLGQSTNDVIRTDGLLHFRAHFEVLIRMLGISEKENDAAWKGARRQLNLREPPENGLGYGKSGRSGSSRPNDLREQILRTSKEIVTLGARDPEMISLMGFFEEGVGPDTISDLTTRVILEDLAKITESFCVRNGVAIETSDVRGAHKLPTYQDTRGIKHPVVLVPQDIVRDLPIANDWADIERAAMENARIRDRVNKYLAAIAKPTVIDKKHALKHAALSSADDFASFLAAIKENASSYDPNKDALGYYKLKEIFAKGWPGLQTETKYDLSKAPSEVMRVAQDSVGLFKHHVENGNLWEELWIEGKPKRERASQLIYYAIADAFCKANNIDISPEAHMGGGPIDFKFSHGYRARVLLEVKRSSGKVVHGYEKQLEFYKLASQTDYAIFVVVDYGDLGTKLDDIMRIRNERVSVGLRASEIVVIDATPKLSASKRS